MAPSDQPAAPVATTRRGAVLVVTIDRPEARNALNRAVADGLVAAYRLLDEDDDLRVGVLTGAGGYFSAGMDLKEFAAGSRLDDTCLRHPPRKPTVAAIEGFALAGGLELALACDLIVAARGALLGLPEVSRGLIASGGGLLRLAQRVPYHLAMELALTGRPITAERGAEIGLVNRVAAPGEALTGALELAEAVAANAPLAIEASTQLLRTVGEWPPEGRWERQCEIAEAALSSDDAFEGARAFAERRGPRWVGH